VKRCPGVCFFARGRVAVCLVSGCAGAPFLYFYGYSPVKVQRKQSKSAVVCCVFSYLLVCLTWT
jgi:hypothetical protein